MWFVAGNGNIVSIYNLSDWLDGSTVHHEHDKDKHDSYMLSAVGRGILGFLVFHIVVHPWAVWTNSLLL